MLIDGADAIIATRRDDLHKARIEVQTLKALNKHNVPVPRLLGTNHSQILLQEEIKGVRLSECLKVADAQRCNQLLSAALDSLSLIHAAASKEELELRVPPLGAEKEWIVSLLERPKVIGKFLDEPAPKLDKKALVQLLQVETPRFVKWDSRPGNALVDDQSKVIWFDWEHAGKRNRLDDMAWVLGDEFVPDNPDIETRLIDAHLAQFADGRSNENAMEYLMAYGSFHVLIRLGLILKYMEGEWWDLDYCIKGDKVGVTLLCAQRLCKRGARWSALCPLTQPLSDWFLQIKDRMEKLESVQLA